MLLILNSLSRIFFNLWYRLFPPEMVKYWLHGDFTKARVIKGQQDDYQMEMEGEKYPYPGFPRGHLLIKPSENQSYPFISRFKHLVKEGFFNALWAELEKLATEGVYHMPPPEKMTPAVRELWRSFEELEHAEVTDDMKGRIKLIKTVLCFVFQEDDAYRFRWQWLMERLNLKKVKLTKADVYYLRGKYFKADKKKKILGIDLDGFQY